MRLSAMLWPFPFLVRLSWATAGAPNPRRRHAPARVYFLRGNGTVFSPGFGRMCGLLRHAGIWAEDLRCVGDLWVRRKLRADHARGKLKQPVVLVGHSCGARYAIHTAGQLEALGIPIALLICVDVAFPGAIPANVQRAVHLYRRRWRLYPARPLTPGPGFAGVIENIDLDAPQSPISPAWLNHLTITSSLHLQAWIVEQVMGVAVSDSPRPGSSVPGDIAADCCPSRA